MGIAIGKVSIGERVVIPAAIIEFNNGSNTIWVQSPEGGTIIRLKCSGKIKTDICKNSPISHVDILIDGDIEFCLSKDAII